MKNNNEGASRKLTDYTKYLFCVPAVIIIAALILNLCGAGINLGIDFTGGSIIEYSLGEEFASADVEQLLSSAGFEDYQVTRAEGRDGQMTNVQIRLKDEDGEKDDEILVETIISVAESLGLTGGETGKVTDEQLNTYALSGEYEEGIALRFGGLTDSDAMTDAILDAFEGGYIACDAVRCVELDNGGEEGMLVFAAPARQSMRVRSVLDGALTEKYPACAYVSIEHAGAVSSGELVKNAVTSLIVALVLMLIYIAIRFDLYSGLATLFGLFHDVAIMLAAMSFFGSRYQLNSSFIAALLTIVGYSINDTIVILDRIRENKKAFPKYSNNDIVCMSVKASLSRTINTSVTTLFTLLALYLLGVSSIREFTFPLIAGMLAGAFSSNLLNGPLWAILLDRHEGRKTTGKVNLC